MPIYPDWLIPAWTAPGVGALMTTRHGGVSAAPFDSFNLRQQIGDVPDAVAHNQARLGRAVGATPVYLNQVHGARVARLGLADAAPDAPVHDADAGVTTLPGIACMVQVADCLPVLFAAPGGRAVGAAHAGWRGLAAGVLEATLHEMCMAAGCEPEEVQVWLGACIGPGKFEVGADVLEAFGAVGRGASRRFVPHAPGKWLADLPQLARDRLLAAGVRGVQGGNWCTVSEASRFFSFRRDRVTGRMAALVWIEPGSAGR
ncbi:MAG: peptidoglycan editing factor PgeF [Rhizobacter sp.]|nr:peptidoglycan editing factor PgeF [Rhizobacter sp.]